MRYTKIPENTFKELLFNAAILVSDFSPSTGEILADNILGATSGGITFTDVPEYQDMGDDIDNCPKNIKELKTIIGRNVGASGTYLTVNTEQAKALISAADIDASDTTKIVPRDYLRDTDFSDLWIVGDYSDKTDDTNGGYIAIKLKNVLNTAGFSLQTTDRAKGRFAFNYTAHYSIKNQSEVPYEMYIKAGEE